MRIDDRFMTIITAIVLIVAVGALVQGNGDGESILGPSKKYAAVEDTYIIPSGKVQQLDVFSNDKNVDRIETADLTIVAAPLCGTARPFNGKIEFLGQDSCAGTVSLTYCVSSEEECEPAIVTLDIRDVNAPGSSALVAEAPSPVEEEEVETAAVADPEETVVEEVETATAEDTTPAEVVEEEVEVAETPDPAPVEEEVEVAAAPQVDYVPEPLPTPTNDDIVQPDEAVELIRNQPDSAPDVEIASTLDSNDHISTETAQTAPVEIDAIEMAAPGFGSEENDIQIATATQAPRVGNAPSGLTATAEAIAEEPAPDAQLQVTEQARVEQPETESGIFASIAQSNTLLGATFSAAKSLLEPTASVEPVAAAQPVTSPGQTQASIIDSSELVSSVETENSVNLPLPQSEDLHVPASRPDIELALNTPATLDIDTTPAALPIREEALDPEPEAALPEDETEQAIIQFLTIEEEPEPEPTQPVAVIPNADSGERPAMIFIQPNEDAAVTVQPQAEEAPAPIENAAVTPEVTVPAPVAPAPARNSTAADCAADMDLAAVPGAEVTIRLNSPCRAGQLFRISHEALEFNATLDASGQIEVTFPVFSDQARISISFIDGSSVEDTVAVPDMFRFNRVAIVWDSPVDLNLHALEYGASRDSDGHVWSGNPVDYRTARRNGGGYMVTLGDDNLLAGPKAEVYSVPLSARTQNGVIELAIEVADQGEVCNDQISIQSLRTDNNALSIDGDVSLSVGDCGASANLVVEDAIQNLRIARN